MPNGLGLIISDDNIETVNSVFNQKNMDSTGVYRIRNVKNGKMYVGSTGKGFYVRCRKHREDLRAGRHHCDYLQKSWNKHGEQSFVFEVVEACDPQWAIAQEQVFIDYWKAANTVFGYNTNPIAGKTSYRKRSPESIERTRQSAIAAHKRISLDPVKSQNRKSHLAKINQIAVRTIAENPDIAEKVNNAKRLAFKALSLNPEWLARKNRKISESHKARNMAIYADPVKKAELSARLKAGRDRFYACPEKVAAKVEKQKATWAKKRAERARNV